MTVSAPDIAELSLSRGQLTSHSLDLHGVRLGDLLGEAIVGTDRYGHLWRLRCLGCGAAVVQHAAKARQRFAIVGAKLACSDCMTEERRGARHERRAWTRDVYREFWERYGDLYGPGWGDRVGAEVLESLVAKIAPIDDTTRPAVGEPLGFDDRTPKPASRQMAAYLYPLDLDGGLIRCVDCGADHDRAFGCTMCLEAACVACVRAERHRCDPGDDCMTLDAVGRNLPEDMVYDVAVGISRERVRQILRRAMTTLLPLVSTEKDDEQGHVVRELERRQLNPGHCWCRQRIAKGRYCSDRCEGIAKEWRLPSNVRDKPALPRKTRKAARLPRARQKEALGAPAPTPPLSQAALDLMRITHEAALSGKPVMVKMDAEVRATVAKLILHDYMRRGETAFELTDAGRQRLGVGASWYDGTNPTARPPA